LPAVPLAQQVRVIFLAKHPWKKKKDKSEATSETLEKPLLVKE
jgi:hypothetical protein